MNSKSTIVIRIYALKKLITKHKNIQIMKNITNYIGFTGTAYLELPLENNYSYENNIKINYSTIEEFKDPLGYIKRFVT